MTDDRGQGTGLDFERALSGRALLLMSGGGLHKAFPARLPELTKQRLSFPFLFSLLLWVHQDADNQERNAQGAKQYPYYYRESFKKITCQSDGEDSLTQVTNNFSNKFPARFINNDHYIIISTKIDVCQAFLEEAVTGTDENSGFETLKLETLRLLYEVRR